MLQTIVIALMAQSPSLKISPDPSIDIRSAVPSNEVYLEVYPKHCKEILEQGNNVSGIYTIQPNLNSRPFMVLCDMDIQGGGWTHVHKRFDGSLNFERNWNDYKYGFGNLAGEFWLGLENMFLLTGEEMNELLVELIDANGDVGYAQYKQFSIGSEDMGYSLKVIGKYNGTTGDSLRHQQGLKFTTLDRDNDFHTGNCANDYHGGWWYNKCFNCNLNGNRYSSGALEQKNFAQGIVWHGYRGFLYSFKSARMMIRPIK